MGEHTARDDRRTSPAVVAVLLLLLVPGSYLGSYLILLEPMRIPSAVPANGVIEVRVKVLPRFRIGDRVAMKVYWPLLQLDKRIRPQYWSDQ